jgi:hypothetical protein
MRVALARNMGVEHLRSTGSYQTGDVAASAGSNALLRESLAREALSAT